MKGTNFVLIPCILIGGTFTLEMFLGNKGICDNPSRYVDELARVG